MIYNIWTIARRELGAIYVQPIAYIYAIAMALIAGLIFSVQLNVQLTSGASPATIGSVLATYAFLAVFTIPAITMRLLAEEQKSGTIELIMTLPLRDFEFVLGKFIAALIFYISALALTLVYPIILFRYGNPDPGPLYAAYLGAILQGSAAIGIGLFASALTKDQINAFMVSFGIILLLFLAVIPADSLVSNPSVATIFRELAFQAPMDNFIRGLILVKNVFYYILLTAVMLFAATRVLESRRWR